MLNNLLAIVGGLFLFATKYAGANSGSVALLIIGRILLGVNAGKLCKEFSRYFASNIKQVLFPQKSSESRGMMETMVLW